MFTRYLVKQVPGDDVNSSARPTSGDGAQSPEVQREPASGTEPGRAAPQTARRDGGAMSEKRQPRRFLDRLGVRAQSNSSTPYTPLIADLSASRN